VVLGHIVAVNGVVMAAVHGFMERKQLRTIRRHAEALTQRAPARPSSAAAALLPLWQH
jgi:hypothetical protein